MRLCLFEDHLVSAFEPLVLTRPVFELVCGLQSLQSKQVRYFGSALIGKFVRPDLTDWLRQSTPHEPVNDPRWLKAGPVVLVNGRWLPPDGPPPSLDEPRVALADDEVAWACLTPEWLRSFRVEDLEEHLASWRREIPNRVAGGRLLRRPWDLIAANGEELIRDFRSWGEPGGGARPLHFALVGPAGRLRIDLSARIDPMVVADTTNGPVVIERDAVVTAFSRLEGPCCIGAGSIVRNAQIRAGTTIGPGCVVGGEVVSAVLHGFVEKPHQGYLGYSYLGAWVEYGAGAQTADRHVDSRLPNGLATFRQANGPTVARGCLVGDHARIGPGTVLPSGASIGAFAQITPTAAMAPAYLPSFTAFRHGRVEHEDAGDSLIGLAEERMERQGVASCPAQNEIYRRLLDRCQGRRLAHDSRRLRESA